MTATVRYTSDKSAGPRAGQHSEELVVAGEGTLHGGAVVLPPARRALDVGEEDRDGARWGASHGARMITSLLGSRKNRGFQAR
jgi:hypothetical protein